MKRLTVARLGIVCVLGAFIATAQPAQSASAANRSPLLSRAPDEIGPNYRRWQTDKGTSQGKSQGSPSPAAESPMAPAMTEENGVVSIMSGMNYWDGQQWSPSDPSFELTDDAFVANRVQQSTRLNA